MTKITYYPGCGNSPKCEFLKRFNVAFATADIPTLLHSVTEDIHWDITGDKIIDGKADFEKSVTEMADYIADEVTLFNIITHGATAAANGEMIMGGSRYAFCDVYEFASAGKQLIKKMTSYVMKVE